MPDTSPAHARLLQVTPLVRGLLAAPTGDQDHPFARVIARPREESAAEALGTEALRLDPAAVEADDLAERLAGACAQYADQHGGARPRAVVLPGLGAVVADAAPAAPATCPLPAHVTLITGAAGAIGAGLCRGLLAAGSHVAVTDLAGERLDSLVQELRQEFPPDRVLGVPLDVTDPASVAAGLDRVIATWGGVDLAVINAGVAHVSTLEEMDLAAFQRLERINVDGALLLLQAMARHFRVQGTGGDIVLVSTKNVFAPGASFGAYSATKAAAHQLARIASLELAPLGVRVNMVAPDAVFGEGSRKSGLWQTVGPDRMRARGLDEQGLEDYYRSRNLLKARVTPEHVAKAVLYFATRQTPTTGATLPVDGGLPDATPR